MTTIIRPAGLLCCLLIGSALTIGCQSDSHNPAKSAGDQKQPSEQTAARDQMLREGDAMIARGKKMYDQGMASHDDGMIQDGRLMMTKGQQMKDKAAMLRQMKVGTSSVQ